MRLFIGIPLAPEVVEALDTSSKRLRQTGDGLRWSPADSWHITLQFLGNTSAEADACLPAHLKDVSSPAFAVHIRGLGFFDRAQIFFADVIVSPALLRLQKSVLGATAQCGFVAESRRFHPHITLARAKGNSPGPALRQLKGRINGDENFPSFTATEFLIYEAFLGCGGSRYEVRERFPLGKRLR